MLVFVVVVVVVVVVLIYIFIADNISISMYIMVVVLCLFSALSSRVGVLLISMTIIIYYLIRFSPALEFVRGRI